MVNAKSLQAHIEYVIKCYGSDAGERKEPGSKAKFQAEHITELLLTIIDANQALNAVLTERADVRHLITLHIGS